MIIILMQRLNGNLSKTMENLKTSENNSLRIKVQLMSSVFTQVDLSAVFPSVFS